MAITTYSELVTAVTTSWPHRADLASANAIEFIALAEERFNRRLRTRHQELALAETAIDASYQVAIPSNVIAVKRMWRTANPKVPLFARTLDFIIDSQAGGGLASGYAWEGSTWRFDGTGSVAGVLYRNIPGLSGSNTTNWLLTAYPSVYLYACLAEGAVYMKDEARASQYDAKAEARILELNRISKQDEYSGSLVVTAR
jgi:hypothetical protein